MTKNQAINIYIKGKISITEVRMALNKIEGKRLVKIYDKKS